MCALARPRTFVAASPPFVVADEDHDLHGHPARLGELAQLVGATGGAVAEAVVGARHHAGRTHAGVE
ncbi:MAG: hypothetical protein AAGF23_02275, partial [Acidobacteriota bacterium]